MQTDWNVNWKRKINSKESEDKSLHQGCKSYFVPQYNYLVAQDSYFVAQDNYIVPQDEESVCK